MVRAAVLGVPRPRDDPVTLAPEADPDAAAAPPGRARRHRALGHSTATYETARGSRRRRAARRTSVQRHGTAAPPQARPRRRSPRGQAADAHLIADLVRMHPAALRLAIRQKHNVGLVTDRVATTGLRITEDEALASPTELAGSTLSMRGAEHHVGLGILSRSAPWRWRPRFRPARSG